MIIKQVEPYLKIKKSCKIKKKIGTTVDNYKIQN